MQPHTQPTCRVSPRGSCASWAGGLEGPWIWKVSVHLSLPVTSPTAYPGSIWREKHIPSLPSGSPKEGCPSSPSWASGCALWSERQGRGCLQLLLSLHLGLFTVYSAVWGLRGSESPWWPGEVRCERAGSREKN